MTTRAAVDESRDDADEQLAFYLPALPKLTTKPGRVERFLQRLHEPSWL